MGGCIGISRNRDDGIDDISGNVTRPNSGSTRKNHPLCHETIRWKSDVPLTEGQLRSKRDEFWDTAPAFEGRKEIWDALRAAAVAAESSDYELAQAILDGANISVPNAVKALTDCGYLAIRHSPTTKLPAGVSPGFVLVRDVPEVFIIGFLTECYDELGARYQVPVYCLSYPINIVKEDNGRDSPAECSEPVDGGTEMVLKLRLSSTCVDVKLPVSSKDSIGMAKKKLQSQEGLEPSRQRWFFGGKLLGDKLRVEEAKILPGYVVQVIVNNEQTPRADS